MSFLIEAKDLQRRDMLVEAARAYEAAFDSERDSLSLDDYLEAAVLYFVCTDFGYSSVNNLPEEFARAAYAEAKSWLEQALRRFGPQPEIRFWQRYVDFVVLGEPPFLEESRKLVETGKTLTPYFYLYSSSTKDSTYEAKAWELYLTIKKGETAKERYIASILGSRFKNRQVETL